jgi:hypothetical protein
MDKFVVGWGTNLKYNSPWIAVRHHSSVVRNAHDPESLGVALGHEKSEWAVE